jgi:hypothetical protein
LRILRRASAPTSSSTPSTHPPSITTSISTTTSRDRAIASPAHCMLGTATAKSGQPALTSRPSSLQRPELDQRLDTTKERDGKRAERMVEQRKREEEERKGRKERQQEECRQRDREAASTVQDRGTPHPHSPIGPRDDVHRRERPPPSASRVHGESGTSPPPPAPTRDACLGWSSHRSETNLWHPTEAVQSPDCTEIKFPEPGEGITTPSPSLPPPPKPTPTPSSEGSTGHHRPPTHPGHETQAPRNAKKRRRRCTTPRGGTPTPPTPPPPIPPPRDHPHRRRRRRRRL